MHKIYHLLIVRHLFNFFFEYKKIVRPNYKIQKFSHFEIFSILSFEHTSMMEGEFFIPVETFLVWAWERNFSVFFNWHEFTFGMDSVLRAMVSFESNFQWKKKSPVKWQCLVPLNSTPIGDRKNEFENFFVRNSEL